EKNWYSCPFNYQGCTVDLKVTPTEVMVFHKGKLIKRHLRFLPIQTALKNGRQGGIKRPGALGRGH
ncbi:MAG: hypothetical protein PHH86_11335, partial [Sphaerochaetaceae bacterium]|nr:hypothetical protein [Sphaerochaetaceae bacterium]